METNIPALDRQETQFLCQIKKELSLQSSQETVRIVASVLQALRQTLTLQSANKLLNRLPDFLKLVFVANWKRNEKHVRIEHLDEFVNLVMEREQENKKTLFRNEVQTLSIVILTLKKLYKMADLDNFEGLSQALRQELREVPTEAAA